MKKILAVLAVVVVLGGCASINNFLCHPTDSQVAAADTAYAMAQSILAGVSTLTGNPVVALLSANAIPVFKQVIEGSCVVAEQWQAAVDALQDAANQTSTKTFRAIPSRQVIADLKSINW